MIYRKEDMKKYNTMRHGNDRYGLIDMINRISSFYSINEMVEIGSFSGESSIIFAGKVKKIYCVDPWISNYDCLDTASFCDMNEVEKEFDDNIEQHDNIVKLKMKSASAHSLFENRSLDFVYIDGIHSYLPVKQDIQMWLPKLKHNRFIGGHDYIMNPNNWMHPVSIAVDETLGKPDWVFRDNSWIKLLK